MSIILGAGLGPQSELDANLRAQVAQSNAGGGYGAQIRMMKLKAMLEAQARQDQFAHEDYNSDANRQMQQSQFGRQLDLSGRKLDMEDSQFGARQAQEQGQFDASNAETARHHNQTDLYNRDVLASGRDQFREELHFKRPEQDSRINLQNTQGDAVRQQIEQKGQSFENDPKNLKNRIIMDLLKKKFPEMSGQPPEKITEADGVDAGGAIAARYGSGPADLSGNGPKMQTYYDEAGVPFTKPAPSNPHLLSDPGAQPAWNAHDDSVMARYNAGGMLPAKWNGSGPAKLQVGSGDAGADGLDMDAGELLTGKSRYARLMEKLAYEDAVRKSKGELSASEKLQQQSNALMEAEALTKQYMSMGYDNAQASTQARQEVNQKYGRFSGYDPITVLQSATAPAPLRNITPAASLQALQGASGVDGPAALEKAINARMPALRYMTGESQAPARKRLVGYGDTIEKLATDMHDQYGLPLDQAKAVIASQGYKSLPDEAPSGYLKFLFDPNRQEKDILRMRMKSSSNWLSNLYGGLMGSE